ncbi:unnamed protein product [Merluccius merluccius]
METPGEPKEPPCGQLISVNRKDTSRLLEVYVKRSLSLNDGAKPPESRPQRKNKWVMMPERPRRMRRHSSDPSLHLSPIADNSPIADDSPIADQGLTFFPSSPCTTETPGKLPEEEVEEEEEEDEEEKGEVTEEKEMKPEVSVSKKRKKPTLLKAFLGLFSKKWGEEDQEEEIQRGATDVFPARQEELPEVSATCLPLAHGTGQKKKSKRRSSIRRRLSFKKSVRSIKDITSVEAIVSVAPTDIYFENVSQEMELIVHQVKDQENEKVLTDEEVINRIIALTKNEGDAIDEKLKENPTLSNFFKGMSYSSFKKLADTYLEEETTPVEIRPVAAPELVQLAFTLDFTAMVAGLSRQNAGHISSLGKLYLQDRFKYIQVSHRWVLTFYQKLVGGIVQRLG